MPSHLRYLEIESMPVELGFYSNRQTNTVTVFLYPADCSSPKCNHVQDALLQAASYAIIPRELAFHSPVTLPAAQPSLQTHDMLRAPNLFI